MEWSYDIWLYNICVAWLKFVWFRLLDCCLSVRLFACLDDYLPGWLGASSFVCPSVCRLWFMSCSHAVAAKGFVVFNMFLSARKCLLHLLCLQQHLRQAWDVARSGSEFYQSKYGHNIKETQFNEFLSFRPGKTLRVFFRMGVVEKHPKICFITANIFCSRTFLLFNNVVF